MSEVPIKISVSHSEADALLRCERNHFYGYGMQIQRKETSESLSRGILGHLAMETYFNFQRDAQKKGLWGNVFGPADAYDAAVAVVQQTDSPFAFEIIGYLVWFMQCQQFTDWEIIAVEQEFVVSLETYDYPFVVDLVARDPFGDVWVIDHKFVYDFINDRDAEMSPQLAKYVGALRLLGFPVNKAGYNQLRTRKMTKPTPASQYMFKEEKLTEIRIQQTMNEQEIAAHRALERKNRAQNEGLFNWSKTALRVANKMVCNSCSFRSLCLAELNGTSPELVLDSEYKMKERREVSPHNNKN